MQLKTEIKSLRGRRYLDEERREHLKGYAESGLSLKAYALKHGMSPASLLSWKKRYEPRPSFVSVKMDKSPPLLTSSESVEVSLRYGDCEVSLKTASCPDELIALLGRLKREVLSV